jgi:hypothetical protein
LKAPPPGLAEVNNNFQKKKKKKKKGSYKSVRYLFLKNKVPYTFVRFLNLEIFFMLVDGTGFWHLGGIFGPLLGLELLLDLQALNSRKCLKAVPYSILLLWMGWWCLNPKPQLL